MPVACKGGVNSPWIIPKFANLFIAPCDTYVWQGGVPTNLDQQLFDDNFLNLEIDGTVDFNNDVNNTKTDIVGGCGARRSDTINNGSSLAITIRAMRLGQAVSAGQLSAEERYHIINPFYDYKFDFLFTPYSANCGQFDFTSDIAWVGSARKLIPDNASFDPSTVALSVPIDADVEVGIYPINEPTA